MAFHFSQEKKIFEVLKILFVTTNAVPKYFFENKNILFFLLKAYIFKAFFVLLSLGDT